MASSLPLRRLPVAIARRQVKIGHSAKRFQSTSLRQVPDPTYPFYPSVEQLLHEKGIPESEVPKIHATGPKGRLLKGDVLAYLGIIAADYPLTQAERIAELSHLDLSNIKLAAAPAKPPAAIPAVEKKALPPAPVETSVAVSISLSSVLSVQKRIQDTLGVTVPLSAFIARATDLANDDLPRSPLSEPTVDELFDEILGAEPIQISRGDYIPDINVVPLEEANTVKQLVEEDDIIDFLSGKVSKRAPVVAAAPVTADDSNSTSAGAVNVLSITVPVEEERRAKVFLERIRTILTVEPGRLVL